MNNPFRDNGGRLPAGITPIINTTGHSIFVSPYPRKRKRRPIVKVRRDDLKLDDWEIPHLTLKTWKWECDICTASQRCLTWDSTQQSATHHAHNHH